MGSGRMTQTLPKFLLRDYEKRDFETVFKLDRLCFDPGIAYSRPELASFIEQRRAYTIVAEWNAAEPDVAESNADELNQPIPETPPTPDDALPAGAQDAGSHSHARAKGQPTPPRRPIAGFVTFHFQRQGYGHIITIDVHPDARRHHLGTLLLEAACERLRKMTGFMVVLEVAVNNHSALAFYDKLGFKRVKVLERYYSRDLDAIFMTKRL
jgi:ribosomal-protein-alanine N-acetyltransferase